MKIALIGGAAAVLCASVLPFVTLAQDAADWISGFPREPVPVVAWPADRKVAVSFALFVEEFGFGQGPVFRPDLASRSPDLVNEASFLTPPLTAVQGNTKGRRKSEQPVGH